MYSVIDRFDPFDTKNGECEGKEDTLKHIHSSVFQRINQKEFKMEKFTGGWFGFMEYQLENGTTKFRLVGKRSGWGGFKSKAIAVKTLNEQVLEVEKRCTIKNLPFTHYFSSEIEAMAYVQSVRAKIK